MSKNLKIYSSAFGLAMTVAAISSASDAHAQLEATGSTFGTPERAIELSMSTQATYDSNVARAQSSQAIARGIEKEDYRFTPSLEANIVLPTPAAVLMLTGTAGYDFYARNTQLDRERINLKASAATKLAICDVGVQASYARQQNDLADLSIVDGDAEASAVNVQNAFSIGGTLGCGGGSIKPTAFVEYRTSNNSSIQREISDVDTLIYGGGVSYSSPAFGVLTAFVGRTEYDYTNRNNIVGAITSFHTTMGGFSLDRRLGARLQANGRIYYVKSDGAGVDDRLDGLNWDVAALLRIGSRAQLGANIARQIDASTAVDLRAMEVTSYGVKLDYVLTPLLRADAGVTYRVRNMEDTPTLPQYVVVGDDKLFELSAGLAYTLGRRIDITLRGNYQKRNADTAIYDYESIRMILGVRLRL
ncbi:hypothetical protein CP98_04535 [Sphingobium yanoikuyae]|uniref:Outer membrane beta-barrel protein n=1 Tax=Sphingobium yanoikuyae TaxID=13690 RepID=A0A084EBF7_SPHYA|nr:outer membrane beta-barrel protein [Sphingobium yanoikuyae]KEZ15299.1 hypothetical protein CP98_04535 [Sphingobium yanoikuyae]